MGPQFPFDTCRGQKHQRREKQAQHLENSEELSHNAVAAVLDDDDQPACPADSTPSGRCQAILDPSHRSLTQNTLDFEPLKVETIQ